MQGLKGSKPGLGRSGSQTLQCSQLPPAQAKLKDKTINSLEQTIAMLQQEQIKMAKSHMEAMEAQKKAHGKKLHCFIPSF
jgi:hypothetical protein